MDPGQHGSGSAHSAKADIMHSDTATQLSGSFRTVVAVALEGQAIFTRSLINICPTTE